MGTTGITNQHLTACFYVVLVWSKEAVLHWQRTVCNPSIIHSRFHISPICLACALPPLTKRNWNGFSVWQNCIQEINLNGRSREGGVGVGWCSQTLIFTHLHSANHLAVRGRLSLSLGKYPLPLLLGLSICQSLIAKTKLSEKVYLAWGLLLLHGCVS